VSKVLRRKETFLHKTDDRSQSPIKRSKGKLPDIDKAMSIWVRKQQQIGVEISDEELLHQARHFAVNTGGGDDSLLKVLNRTWVDKFKQKNGVGMPRLLRRASETSIPTGHVKMSTASSPALGHGVISPTSPAGDATATAASPTSADRSDEETAQHGLGFLSYPSEGGGFRRSASQSVTSLNTALSADAATGGTMSSATLSPARSFHFSPDPNAGAFITAGAGSNFQRPRSQTFPTLDMEYMNQQHQNSTESTPRVLPPASTAPTSALDSPTHELTQGVFGIASPHLRHSSSNSSMAGRSTSDHVASGMSSTPAGSTPTSPTQEDARRAVDTLLSFINNSGQGVFVDHNDYNTLLRLTDKLRLHQSQMAKVAGLGGLSRIPEGDVEMVHTGSATP
jgi:Tc5 transposase-like DNA-binding protein